MTINRLMKRSVAIILIILALAGIMLLSFSGCQKVLTDFDIKTSKGEYGDKAYSYMQELSGEYANRTMATEGEKKAAEYISSLMSGWGYTSEYETDGVAGLDSFKLGFNRYDGSSVKDSLAYNVIFTKKSAQSKGEIILMAQYDNLYAEKGSEGEWAADGSYESGAGVAVMLTLAELMKDTDYGYDITFAFFTGGSYTWMGAKHFADNLKRADVENIKLAVNFSMLAGGTNLYLYTGETQTSYGNYLAKASQGLTKLPANKQTGNFILESSAIYNYSHIGMLGNQYYLMNKGIPVANYLSLDWSTNDNPMMTEIKGKTNVYHTKDDTFANMIERKGEENVKSMTNDVINSVLVALDTQNSEVMTKALSLAKDEQVNQTAQSSRTATWINISVKAVVIALIFGGSIAVKNYVQKNRDKYIVNMGGEENSSEQEKEPFDDNFDTFKSDSQEEKNNEPTHHKKDDDDPFV